MSTLHVSNKTHPGVLLQPQALEDAVADNQQGTDATGHTQFASANEAGVQHGRGETANTPVRVSQRHRSTASAVAGNTREGVPQGKGNAPGQQPRVFVLSKDGKPLDPTTPRRARLLLKSGRAVVPSGKKKGTHTGRVAVRATGSFNINTAVGTIQGVSHRHCTVLQRGNGYGYLRKEEAFSSRP